MDKIRRYYWREVIGPVTKRRNALRTMLNLFCFRLGIQPPSLFLCDVSRQNNCMIEKKKPPCGGGCYERNSKIIFFRDVYGGMDTLLHELFHHVNELNGNQAIKQIMNDWIIQEFEVTRGYGELLRSYGIPMRKPK